MARVANKRVLPGFGLSLGFTLDVPVADRPDPAVGGVPEGGDDGAAGILERRDVATGGRILQIDVRRRAAGCRHQCILRVATWPGV